MQNWLEAWIERADTITHPVTVNFYFDFLIKGSSGILFNFMKKLEILHYKDVAVTVNWYYEKDDEDVMEYGGGIQEFD
jgi:hypothetical protein